MLADGQYSVWFKAAQGEGTGVVTLTDGRITGRDDKVSYSGSYEQLGDHFSATIRTARHSPGRLPLFQIDQLDIDLQGNSRAPIASASGSVRQVPGARLDVTLIPRSVGAS